MTSSSFQGKCNQVPFLKTLNLLVRSNMGASCYWVYCGKSKIRARKNAVSQNSLVWQGRTCTSVQRVHSKLWRIPQVSSQSFWTLGSFPVLSFRLLKTHLHHFTLSTSTEKQLVTTGKLGTFGTMYWQFEISLSLMLINQGWTNHYTLAWYTRFTKALWWEMEERYQK